MRPLEGLKVVDFSMAASGPCCTKIMAEWGADVVKIEVPGGEMMRRRPYELYEWNNLNKKDLVLDAKTPEGLGIIYKLVKEADFFVTNFRLKALDKLKLDYDSLLKINPKIVYGSITGYGTEGPLGSDPGYDITSFWARTGLLYEMVDKGSSPLISPLGVGDYAIGPAILAGLLAGYYMMKQTGKGQNISSSLYSMGLFVNQWYLMRPQADPAFQYPVARAEVKEPMSNCYKTKDGEWFQLTLFDFDKFFPILLKICHREELLGTPGYSSFQDLTNNNIEVIKILDKGFAEYNAEDLYKIFKENQVAFGKINLPGDALKDEQAWANNFLFHYEFRDGRKIDMPSTPIKFNNINEVPPHKYAPRLGEDSRSVLKALHYTDEQIDEYVEKGIIQAYGEKGIQ